MDERGTICEERVRYPIQIEKWISYFQAFVYCSVYYIKKLALFPIKDRAVYSNAFHDNRHMWDYHEYTCEIIDFISGGKINKTHSFI